MKKSKLTAKTLRGILVFSIFVIISTSAVGFYFVQNWLSNLSIDISNTVATSNSSGNNLQSLSKLESELASRQGVIKKASALISSSNTYQGQSIKDLTKYANATGMVVSNYSFGQATTVTGKTSSQAKTNDKSTVTLSVVSPVSYTSLLKFLDAVESNLPKMQVSSVTLGRISGDSSSVRVDKITIEVFTS